MKYWISLVNTVEVDQFVDIACKAEELGYEDVALPDHLAWSPDETSQRRCEPAPDCCVNVFSVRGCAPGENACTIM